MVYILIFSIMSPVGAFLGVVAQSLIAENTLVVAVLNGIACGTLLFVTFFEVSALENPHENPAEYSKLMLSPCLENVGDGFLNGGFLMSRSYRNRRTPRCTDCCN